MMRKEKTSKARNCDYDLCCLELIQVSLLDSVFILLGFFIKNFSLKEKTLNRFRE